MCIFGDFKIPISDRKDDFFGAGFSLIADRTAIYNVNQNILSLFGSYHKAINPDQNQFLSAGVSFGLSQRNINYENIFFQDQFNGLDEYSLPSAEILPSNNFAFADIGLGVTFTSALSDYSSIAVGFSGDHLPGSSISFYTHSIDQEISYPDFKIDRKWTGFVSLELASNEYVSVLPRVIWQKQGPYQMISAAGLVKFDLTNYDNQALHVGGGVRFNQKVDSGLGTTAFYVMTAYQLSGLLIGLSHDFTTSALRTVSPGNGAFEISISFTGLFENEESMCPTV